MWLFGGSSKSKPPTQQDTASSGGHGGASSSKTKVEESPRPVAKPSARLTDEQKRAAEEKATANKIKDLRGKIEGLEKKREYLELQEQEHQTNAKTKLGKGDRGGAKMSLMRSQNTKKQMENLDNQILLFEKQVLQIETAVLNKQTIDAMKEGQAIQKELQKEVNPDVVENLMDEIHEAADQTEEINQLFAGQAEISMQGMCDVGDLESQLDAMASKALEEKLLDADLDKIGGSGVPSNAVPAVPSYPKPVQLQASNEDEEARQLKELEAELGF